MFRLLTCLTILSLPCLSFAQRSAPRDSPADDSNAKLVAVQVAVLESNGEFQLKDGANLSAANLNDLVAKLRAENVLEYYQYFNLASLENQEAMIQFGQEENVITGRTFAAPSQRGGSGNIGRVMNVTQREQTGSMIQVVSRVKEDGQIIVQLNVNSSRLKAAKTAMSDEEAEEDPTEINTPQKNVLTCQTTVLLSPGVSTVVAAGGNDQPGGSSRDYIIITATAK